MTTTPTIWKAGTNVYADSSGVQNIPHVTGLAGGDYLVVWADDTKGSGADNEVMAQRFTPEGIRIGDPFQVNSLSTDDREAPTSVVALPDGGFVVAYVDTEGASPSVIRLERYDSSGTVTFTTSINNGGNLPGLGVLAVSASGDYLLTFHRGPLFDEAVRGIVFNGLTNATSGEFDAADNTGDLGEVSHDTASLANGNFASLYFTQHGNNTALEVMTFNASGTQQMAPITVVKNSFADGRITGLGGGGFVVGWNDVGADISFRIVDDNGVLGDKLTEATGTHQLFIEDVVGLRDGGFFLVWFDEETTRLVGQRYDAAGDRIGSRVLVAANAGFGNTELSLSADGRILAVYSSQSGEVRHTILDPRNNTINGTAAGEIITTQVGDTTLSGLGGDDVLLGQRGRDTISGGDGKDEVRGGGGSDRLNGGVGIDKVYGGTGADEIVIDEGDEGDHVFGGAGVDTLDLHLITANSVYVNLRDGEYQVPGGSYASRDVSSIEIVIATQDNDYLIGSDGDDDLRAQGGNDELEGGEGADNLNGGTGTDEALYENAASGVIVDLTTRTGSGGEATGDRLISIEHITGSDFDDQLTGSDKANNLFGGDGDDSLAGLAGNDRLLGDSGIDQLAGGIDDDRLDGGTGNDTLNGGAGDDVLVDTQGNDAYRGGAGLDEVTYESASTGVTVDLAVLTGQDTGGGGIDSIDGVENLAGGFGDDILQGNESGNRLKGNLGADTLSGRGGNDELLGGDDGDSLDGGEGIDRLAGGHGKDVLTGGNGNDTFAFGSIAESLPGSERDVIADFSQGEDKIDLSDVISGAVGGAFTFIGGAAFGNIAGELRFEQSGGSTIIEADTTGDGSADMEIEVTGLFSLLLSDFIV